MKKSAISCFFVLFATFCLLVPPTKLSAQQLSLAAHARNENRSRTKSSGGGIKEDIPDKYKERYLQWKNEFLASETGLAQWQAYTQNTEFTLTIAVSKDDRNGAGSGKYKWDDSGKLIAATITLGSRIDEGYPNPIYYPVMNSLAQCTLSYAVGGNILAAAKIAHEFGHVNRMAATDGATYKLQTQLMPTYNKILLTNGRNTNDPRLVDLAHQMGGTPVEIWEDREYWGEVNAMRYLRDRITKESEQRALFTRIIRTVELYAKSYVDRFDEVGQ
jgi:hypothetical protein